MNASVRTCHVRTDGFLSARTVKSVRGVNTDVRRCLNGKFYRRTSV
jgi:hypothetical protein